MFLVINEHLVQINAHIFIPFCKPITGNWIHKIIFPSTKGTFVIKRSASDPSSVLLRKIAYRSLICGDFNKCFSLTLVLKLTQTGNVCPSDVFFIDVLTLMVLTDEVKYLVDPLPEYCPSKCKFKPRYSSEEQTSALLRVGWSLSDPHSFSRLSLSISVSPSPSPSLGQPQLLCPSSLFYFMPRPSLDRSSSINTRTLICNTLSAAPPFSDQLCIIQMQPSLWLITSSDSIWHSLHQKIPFTIQLRHIRRHRRRLGCTILYLLYFMTCSFIRVFSKDVSPTAR